MIEKPMLIKEIATRNSTYIEFSGSMEASYKIKEILEIRHDILPIQVQFGSNTISYNGEIRVKAYCISLEHHTLFQIEQKFHLRGYTQEEVIDVGQKYSITANPKLLDIFTEIKNTNGITVFGIISLETIKWFEREISPLEFQSLMGKPIEKSSPIFDNSKTTKSEKQSDQMYTEVTPGSSEDITLILD